MNLPDDLRHFHADDDSFVLFDPDFCIAALAVLILIGAIFAPYL